MLRVIRNHRRAAYGETEGYEACRCGRCRSMPTNCPDADLVTRRAPGLGRSAVASASPTATATPRRRSIAPTGTIGLVMDCDTTGIEPDFALVKFKKLAGGGYFKIINRTVPAALKNLGYNEEQIEDIIRYAVGHGTLATGAGHQPRRAQGASASARARCRRSSQHLAGAFDIRFAFNKWTLGEEFCTKVLGFTERAADRRQLRHADRARLHRGSRSTRPTPIAAAP